MVTLVDQLEKLNELHSKGILTQEEFDASKKATIQQYSLPPTAASSHAESTERPPSYQTAQPPPYHPNAGMSPPYQGPVGGASMPHVVSPPHQPNAGVAPPYEGVTSLPARAAYQPSAPYNPQPYQQPIGDDSDDGREMSQERWGEHGENRIVEEEDSEPHDKNKWGIHAAQPGEKQNTMTNPYSADAMNVQSENPGYIDYNALERKAPEDVKEGLDTELLSLSYLDIADKAVNSVVVDLLCCCDPHGSAGGFSKVCVIFWGALTFPILGVICLLVYPITMIALGYSSKRSFYTACIAHFYFCACVAILVVTAFAILYCVAEAQDDDDDRRDNHGNYDGDYDYGDYV